MAGPKIGAGSIGRHTSTALGSISGGHVRASHWFARRKRTRCRTARAHLPIHRPSCKRQDARHHRGYMAPSSCYTHHFVRIYPRSRWLFQRRMLDNKSCWYVYARAYLLVRAPQPLLLARLRRGFVDKRSIARPIHFSCSAYHLIVRRNPSAREVCGLHASSPSALLPSIAYRKS